MWAGAGFANEPAEASKASAASAKFSEGQAAYNAGRYREAIAAFRHAQRLAPHAFTLFNIARCHENLGEVALAAEHYQLALEQTTDASTRLDVIGRLERLRKLPVKIFVGSEPNGAAVTIDRADRTAASKQTPAVLQLSPGRHCLFFRKRGYQLGSRCLVVRAGQEQSLTVPLEAEPACPKVKPCTVPGPAKPLLDEVYANFSALGALGWSAGRPLVAAPGFRVYAGYRNWVFGGHLLYYVAGQTPIEPEVADGVTYDKVAFRWMLVQAESGWVFPLPHARIELTGGIGVSIDRVEFVGQDVQSKQTSRISEKGAFSWSVGATILGYVTSWLSAGVGGRFGMIHGGRVDKDQPRRVAENSHFPYLNFWGTLNFQL